MRYDPEFVRFSLLLLVFHWILTFGGCSELSVARRDPECGQMIKHIDNDWFYNKEDKIYAFDRNETDYQLAKQLFLKKQCLKGWSRKSIQKLFGSPSEARSNELRYYLSRQCNGSRGVDSNGCQYFYISFDEQGGMKDLSISTLQIFD